MSIDVSTQKKLDYKCARLVIFSGLANELSEFTDEKGNITKIIADDYIIEVGKTVKAGKKVFKVNYIKQHKLREDRGLYVFNYDLMFDKLLGELKYFIKDYEKQNIKDIPLEQEQLINYL